MRDQLEALEELSHIDARLVELGRELDRIPGRMKDLDAEFETLRNLLERERELLKGAEEWDQQTERELRIQEELLGKSRGKQASARNERELNAAQREVEEIRKAMSEKEAERVQVLDAISERRKSIAQHEADIAELETQVGMAEAEAKQQGLGVEAERAKWIEQRQQIEKKLRPRVLKLYEHVRSSRPNAVVEVLHETCQGCNMQIPPQTYIEVQRMEKIYQCPYCSRIFYFAYAKKEASQACE